MIALNCLYCIQSLEKTEIRLLFQAAGNFVEVDMSTGEFIGLFDDAWISVSEVTGVVQDVAVKKKRSKRCRRVEYNTSDQSEGEDAA